MEHELLKQADKVLVAWMLGCISDYDGSPALEPEDVELGKLNTMAMQCIADDVKHIAFVWAWKRRMARVWPWRVVSMSVALMSA